jgi:hypothetical protein
LGQIYCVADNPEAAADIAEAVNNHDRLTAEVARLRESLAECVEALVFLQDRAHMRVNPPTVEKAQKLLNPEEPK